VFAQDGSQPLNSCTESDSPIIQGLRLGTLFSAIKQDTKLDLRKKFDTVLDGIDRYKIESPNQNVDRLFLDFYKNRLIGMTAIYSATIKWNSLQEFAEKISESLNVFGQWKITKPNGEYSFDMDCKHFYLNLSRTASNHYTVTSVSSDILGQKLDDEAQEQKRKDAINRKKKETFKP
jgi:hypothetical protein